jgi:hypothetical protein
VPHPQWNLALHDYLATGGGFVAFGTEPQAVEWGWDGVRRRAFGGHEKKVCGAALEADRLVTVGGKTVKVWDWAEGDCVATCRGHPRGSRRTMTASRSR